MRTEKYILNRNLICFVYRIYKKSPFEFINEYENSLYPQVIENAFMAYRKDPIFRKIFDTLKFSFKDLLTMEDMERKNEKIIPGDFCKLWSEIQEPADDMANYGYIYSIIPNHVTPYTAKIQNGYWQFKYARKYNPENLLR